MNLVICPSCHRHVNAREAECPFCKAPARDACRPALAAAMVIGLGLAVGGCSSSSTTTTTVEDAATDGSTVHHDSGFIAAYAAPIDAAEFKDSAKPKDAAKKDSGDAGFIAAYAAPVDAAEFKDSARKDSGDGGIIAADGPPPGDAGKVKDAAKKDSGDGGIIAAYGPPPGDAGKAKDAGHGGLVAAYSRRHPAWTRTTSAPATTGSWGRKAAPLA